MLPLAFAELNKEVTIKDIREQAVVRGNCWKGVFVEVEKLCVLRWNGGVVVKMNDCKYALNFGLGIGTGAVPNIKINIFKLSSLMAAIIWEGIF